MRFNTVPLEDHSRLLIGHVNNNDYVCFTLDNDMRIGTVEGTAKTFCSLV